ncbi:MAG: response regulator, partial [Lachnospiraceae bacterium]|nr:response regulator [Lachnospiraceae bacterium]
GRKERNITFAIMLTLNIILMIGVVIGMGNYMKVSDDEKRKTIQDNTENNTYTVVKQIGNQLNFTANVVNGYADYIEGEKLSLEEATAYLDHWKSFYKRVLILDSSARKGISLDGYGQDKVLDLTEESFVDDLERQSKAVGEKVFLSDVYKDNIGDNCVSFCRRIEIKKKEYILLFEYLARDILNKEMGVLGMEEDNGFIIDQNGNLVVGELPWEGEENFYDYVKKTYGNKRLNNIEKTIAQGGKDANFKLMVEKEQTLWTFCKIEGTRDWVYMYYHAEPKMFLGKDIRQNVFLVFVLMVIWVLLDILAYFFYNRRLRRSLDIIERQNEDLIKANEAKTMFVSNVSHEIRTPINAVLGMDEMILRETKEENIKSYARDIRNSGKVLLDLINDVLDFSKIESGKMDIINVNYEFGDMVAELCDMIDMKARAKFLHLEVDVNPQIPNGLVGDDLRIKQVLINILTNAVKYTEKGTITFKMDYEKLDDAHILLKASIKDTGVGMKKEELYKLCSAFERLDEKKNRSVEGTGLGMSIVTGLLSQMGSTLHVESVYGEGSLFSFEIKQEVADWEAMGDFNLYCEKRRNEDEKPMEVVIAKDMNVLVVDDNKVNVKVTLGLLKRTEVKADVAYSGEECLEKVAKKKYDMIFLDHRMPIMDGVETVHHIRENQGPNQNTVVIALTANVVAGAKKMYLEEGFNGFLSKPIDVTKLEKTIQYYYEKSKERPD